MSCACGKHKSAQNSEKEVQQTEIPAVYLGVDVTHTILPSQSCIYCAEKHVANALALLSRYGTRAGYRLAALGELDAARRHAQLEFTDVASAIKGVEQPLLESYAYDPESLKTLAETVQLELSKHDDGMDTVGTSRPPTPAEELMVLSRPSRHPLAGLLLVACAWRLALEVGYEDANRMYVLGDLSEAQTQLLSCDQTLTEEVRDLRHSIQNHDKEGLDDRWMSLAVKLDNAQRMSWGRCLSAYGTDVSYLFEPPHVFTAAELVTLNKEDTKSDADPVDTPDVK